MILKNTRTHDSDKVEDKKWNKIYNTYDSINTHHGTLVTNDTKIFGKWTLPWLGLPSKERWSYGKWKTTSTNARVWFKIIWSKTSHVKFKKKGGLEAKVCHLVKWQMTVILFRGIGSLSLELYFTRGISIGEEFKVAQQLWTFFWFTPKRLGYESSKRQVGVVQSSINYK